MYTLKFVVPLRPSNLSKKAENYEERKSRYQMLASNYKALMRFLKSKKLKKDAYPLMEVDKLFSEITTASNIRGEIPIVVIDPTGEPEFHYTATTDSSELLSTQILREFVREITEESDKRASLNEQLEIKEQELENVENKENTKEKSLKALENQIKSLELKIEESGTKLFFLKSGIEDVAQDLNVMIQSQVDSSVLDNLESSAIDIRFKVCTYDGLKEAISGKVILEKFLAEDEGNLENIENIEAVEPIDLEPFNEVGNPDTDETEHHIFSHEDDEGENEPDEQETEVSDSSQTSSSTNFKPPFVEKERTTFPVEPVESQSELERYVDISNFDAIKELERQAVYLEGLLVNGDAFLYEHLNLTGKDDFISRKKVEFVQAHFSELADEFISEKLNVTLDAIERLKMMASGQLEATFLDVEKTNRSEYDRQVEEVASDVKGMIDKETEVLKQDILNEFRDKIDMMEAKQQEKYTQLHQERIKHIRRDKILAFTPDQQKNLNTAKNMQESLVNNDASRVLEDHALGFEELIRNVTDALEIKQPEFEQQRQIHREEMMEKGAQEMKAAEYEVTMQRLKLEEKQLELAHQQEKKFSEYDSKMSEVLQEMKNSNQKQSNEFTQTLQLMQMQELSKTKMMMFVAFGFMFVMMTVFAGAIFFL